ncbi:MAG TPA: DUF4097 family beta strand repeat-containing protein [Candidatus Acidoferrum sp.]|jgi:DUF4097 and DUF4098 domain-containing protein YvlB|nr:DUF4097 family beta strand repeat-containing protein [Candidatus Acidoferrum sp.]
MSTPSVSSHFSGRKAAILVPGLLALTAVPVWAKHLEKHFKVEAHPIVTIHNPSGTITIKAWTKQEVMVMADQSSDAVEVEADQTNNRIDIMTHQVSDSASPDQLRADYQVNVPEDAELQIHDDSGAVNVANVLGDMNVETIGAGVGMADTAGYSTISTVSGSFQCLRCAGRIEVKSISGNINLDDLRSYDVQAQTSTGKIVFNGEFLPNGSYRLKNYSGVIEVRFSPIDSFELNAASVKGDVINEAKLDSSHHGFLPRVGNSLIGALNAGRAHLEVNTFNGTINILKRN